MRDVWCAVGDLSHPTGCFSPPIGDFSPPITGVSPVQTCTDSYTHFNEGVGPEDGWLRHPVLHMDTHIFMKLYIKGVKLTWRSWCICIHVVINAHILPMVWDQKRVTEIHTQFQTEAPMFELSYAKRCSEHGNKLWWAMVSASSCWHWYHHVSVNAMSMQTPLWDFYRKYLSSLSSTTHSLLSFT